MSKYLPNDMTKWNPFNDNHLFNPKDLKRAKLDWRDKLRVLFKPMLVMIADGGVYYYKVSGGQYYFFKYVSHDGKTVKEPESNWSYL